MKLGLWGILIVYLLILLRITLFKQVFLFHLPAAVGASERVINLIPLASVFEMIQTGTSMQRILENVLGNVLLFLPLGLLLPVLFRRIKDSTKAVLCCGACVSFMIEAVQFIFALGSTDIDDLWMNVFGVLVGAWIYRFIRKIARSEAAVLWSVLILLTAAGLAGTGALFVTNTDLFLLSPKEIIVENEELVADFIETPSLVNGRFVELNGTALTVEKSVSNAQEKRENLVFQLTEDSRIYVCRSKTDYLFQSIRKEHSRYEEVTYADFVSNRAAAFDRNNPLRIWSADGERIDAVIVIVEE